MIGVDTLKSPAAHRAIIVDQAEIVVAQKLAASIDVRQHLLDHAMPRMLDCHVDRKRPEACMFMRLEQHGEFVPILPAAIHSCA
jgi:hypothetical protein